MSKDEQENTQEQDINKIIDDIKKDLDSGSSAEKKQDTTQKVSDTSQDIADLEEKIAKKVEERMKQNQVTSDDTSDELKQMKEKLSKLEKERQEAEKLRRDQTQKFKTALDRLSGSKAIQSANKPKPRPPKEWTEDELDTFEYNQAEAYIKQRVGTAAWEKIKRDAR